MNEEHTAVAVAEPQPPAVTKENGRPDAKQMRVEQVGALLAGAYQGASTLKLTTKEAKDLMADFGDDHVEIRGFDGIIYISHMSLRERLWAVFGPTEVAEICRERMMRQDTNEVLVDLVLMIRGHFVAEAIGTAKWYPNNPKTSFGDTVESAWSEALRRCCKKIGVGTQVWRPAWARKWTADHAQKLGGEWKRTEGASQGGSSVKLARNYELRSPEKPSAAESAKEETDDIPF
jgi:hypothetical protein